MAKGWQFRTKNDAPWQQISDEEATQIMTYPGRDNSDIPRVKNELLLGGKLMVRGGMIRWAKR